MSKRTFTAIFFISMALVALSRTPPGLAQMFFPPRNLSMDSLFSVNPAIAVDSAGNVNVVWANSPIQDIGLLFTRSTDAGESFGAPMELPGTRSGTDPDIAVAGNDIYIVFAPVNGGIGFMRSTDRGSSFFQPLTIAPETASNPAIAKDASGVIHLTWLGTISETPTVRYTRSTTRGARSFAPAQSLSSTLTGTETRSPDVAADGAGNVYLVWQTGLPGADNSPSEIVLRRSTDGGRSFELFPPVRQVSSTLLTPSTEPAIAVDGQGAVGVVWADGDGILFGRSTDRGESFLPAVTAIGSQTVFPGENVGALTPGIAPDEAGTTHVVGSFGRLVEGQFTNLDIVFARSTDTGRSFEQPLNLTTNEDGQFAGLPAITVDSMGNPYLVWSQLNGQVLDIFFTRPFMVQPEPDLVVRDLALSSQSASPGEVVTVSFRIVNQGQGTAQGTTHQLFISSDANITTADQLLTTVSTASLATGASTPFSVQVTIPASTAPGDVFIGAIADSSDAVEETNEANNTAAAGLTIAEPADLIVSQLAVSPATISPGGAVTVDFTISNRGGTAANGTLHEIRLSPDAGIGRDDPLLATVSTGVLNPGAAIPFSLPVTIPANAPGGTGFIGVVADSSSSIPESNETNNVATFQIEINLPPTFSVVDVFPDDGALNVPLLSNIEVRFSAPLVIDSVNAQTFQVTTSGRIPVRGTLLASEARVIFYPGQELSAQTTFRLRIVGGPGGVRGSVEGISVSLASDFSSLFVTEATRPAPQPTPPVTPEGSPVRVESGGAINDDAGTGARAAIPAYTLKADTAVNITVLDGPARLAEINNDCDVAIEEMPVVVPLPGFLRASELVRFESDPCDAVAFSPAMDLTFPLRAALRGAFLIGTPLRVFQLIDSGAGLAFADTGIDAQVSLPGSILFGDFAVATGMEVFGTYALFVPLDGLFGASRSRLKPPGRGQPVGFDPAFSARFSELLKRALPLPSDPMTEEKRNLLVFGAPGEDPALRVESLQASDNKVFFPLVEEGVSRATRISFANPDLNQDRVVRLTFSGNDGSSGEPLAIIVPPGGQTTFPMTDLFPSGAIVAEADGPVTGFYEIADDFDAPTMLDGAEAVTRPLTAMVFPLVRTTEGAFTEVHLLNPHDVPVDIRLTVYRADGHRINLTEPMITLAPGQKVVSSSAGGTSTLNLPLDRIEGGYLFVETLSSLGVVGAELHEEIKAGERNLAVLNGVAVPAGCESNGRGECRLNSSIPTASRQHSAYAIHFEPDESFRKELVLVNLSGQSGPVAVSVFDSTGQFRAKDPSVGFRVIGPHEVLSMPVNQLMGVDVGAEGGIIRVEDPFSLVVGAMINRDMLGRQLTALPLVPDLARDGQVVTDEFLSRIQIENGLPQFNTGLFILNPNNNLVSFEISVIDANGEGDRVPVSSPFNVVSRGTFIEARTTLETLFGSIARGYAEVKATPNFSPGSGERLILYGVYRGERFLSAVPAQE